MRKLLPAPESFVSPRTGAPAFGSYEGGLPRVTFDEFSLKERALRRKRWLYTAIASDDTWLSVAVVRMGYATSAFAYVLDLRSRRMLFDRSVVAPPKMAVIADDPRASGTLARFGFGRTHVALERSGSACALRARFAGLEVDATWDESVAPPGIAAIADLGPSLASSTEKRALAAARGSLVAHGQRRTLDGAFAGYDYTHGLLPRHTRWKWAFAMGHAKRGAPIALNVVEGFVGEAECAAFWEGRVHPLAEPRFDFDPAHPGRPWRIRGAGLELDFDAFAVHEQRTNLGWVRTRFLQPVGTFRGVIQVGGRDVELEGVPGVVEDQDVLW